MKSQMEDAKEMQRISSAEHPCQAQVHF